MDLIAEQRRVLLDVARETIRMRLGARIVQPLVVPDDPVLHQPAGCFVSLHTLFGHRLRGCVGRLDTREPLIAVVRQSGASVLEDPRFMDYPVCLHELQDLSIEISVIFPLQPASHCLDFDLLSEGIFLTVASRTGCFLPQVARETGWKHEQLLDRLCTEKLGLAANSWRSAEAKLMKFRTLLIGPEPFSSH